jgi:PAS domain S-box-containing protein
VIGEAAFITIRPYIERVLAGECVEHESEVSLRNGAVKAIYRAVYVPVRDPGGSIIGWIARLADITDRKQAEQKLAERNTQLSLAGKAGLVGTYAYDADTEIMRISEGYAAIHGFPDGTAEIARSKCLASVHSEDIERVQQARDEAFCKGSREYSVEYRIIRPGGEVRWVETRCFISYESEGRPQRVIGVSIDISERRQRNNNEHCTPNSTIV